MIENKRFLSWLMAIGVLGCGKPVAPPSKPGGSTTSSSATVSGNEPRAGETSSTNPGPGTTSVATNPAGGPSRLAISEIFVLPAAGGPNDKLSMDEIHKLLDDPKNHEAFVPEAPLGLGDVGARIPAENPMTRAKVELGRMLYFDPRLSRDSTVSCSSCHDPSNGWAMDTRFAAGINGQLGGRNSPTVMNRIFGKTQFWDGRAASLEDQALGPIQNPIEMGFTLDELVDRLKGIEGYRMCFEKVFGDVSAENIGRAIASFERTVLVGASPSDFFNDADRFRKLDPDDLKSDHELAVRAKAAMAAADAHPLSESANRGRELFFGNKASCSLCHVGSNLTDEEFYNIGVGMDQENPNIGRKEVSKEDKDTGAFKTPTLRNVAMNAPYMHDGSQKTLMEVVEHYDKGGTPNPHLHQRMKKLNLTQQEKEDLVAFMKEGLTGSMLDIPKPKLP